MTAIARTRDNALALRRDTGMMDPLPTRTSSSACLTESLTHSRQCQALSAPERRAGTVVAIMSLVLQRAENVCAVVEDSRSAGDGDRCPGRQAGRVAQITPTR